MEPCIRELWELPSFERFKALIEARRGDILLVFERQGPDVELRTCLVVQPLEKELLVRDAGREGVERFPIAGIHSDGRRLAPATDEAREVLGLPPRQERPSDA